MHAMSSGLWDLSENASEKLEDVEGLPLRIGGEGVVMRGLSLIEDSASPFCPVDPRQGEGASQEVACEPLEAIGVLRPDGGRVVHGKAATMERAQKLDSLVAQKVSSLQQEEGFVSEQLLGDGGIDVGNGKPSSLGVPDSSGCKAMDMGVWVDEASKGLRHGDDSGPNVFVVDGF